MGKTSIDGLAVRSSTHTSGPRRAGTVAARTKQRAAARRTTDGIKPVSPKNPAKSPVKSSPKPSPKSTPKAAAKKPASLDMVAKKPTLKSIAAVEEDFLSPVEGLGFSDPDDDFAAASANDWSDLLDEVNEKKSDSDASADDPDNPDSPKNPSEQNPDECNPVESGEDPKKGRKGKKPKKKRKLSRRAKIIISVVSSLVVILLALWINALIARLTNGKSGLWDMFGSLMSETVPFDTDEHGRTNVLVLGTGGFDMDGSANGGQHDGAALTDSIMIISFDQNTKDVALLSIPRDLKVSGACYAGKINEVYTCNNPDGNDEATGAEALASELSEILDVDFQYWAHVNWGSLTEIVNTLGGVTVTLSDGITDYPNNIVIPAGVPTPIDGNLALGIARARYGTQGGDFSRGNNQQKLIEAIIQKMISNGVGFSEGLNLLNILGDNLRSSFSTDNFKAGIHFISGFDSSTIRNISLVDYENNKYYVKTDTIGGISFVVPSLGVGRYDEIQDYVARSFSSNPAVREGAEIAIYNATDVSGVASAEQTRLEGDGYLVEEIGDAAVGDCSEKYCLYILDDSLTATKSALESRYSVSAKPASELPRDIYSSANVIVIIGAAE